jgi:predicted phage terminase large subunit-like protein
MQFSPGKVEEAIKNTAMNDGRSVRVGIPQDPGQAGKAQVHSTVRNMDGFDVSSHIETGDKVTRFGPFSAQVEAGNVQILRGFSEESLRCLESFPDGRYKDDADACSGAFEMFNGQKGMALFDFLRSQFDEKQQELI